MFINQLVNKYFVVGITLEISMETASLLTQSTTFKDMKMKKLTVMTLSALCAASLSVKAAPKDDLMIQVRADAEQQLVSLQYANQQHARLALTKAIIDVMARLAAKQDVAEIMLVNADDAANSTEVAGE